VHEARLFAKRRAVDVGKAASSGAAPEPQGVSIDHGLPSSGQWDKAVSQRDGHMHEIEWRDWVRQYLGGLEAQIAAVRSLEARVAVLEGKRRGYEASLRVGRPWEAEGISRSAWYRRRKSSGSL
jgi:hypothetical protein